MRATRAYIASLGTTGILLAASVAMLIVVSALVAFDGWGRDNISDDVEQLFVADERPDLRVSGPAQAALDAAPAARAVASRPARPRAATPRSEVNGTLPQERDGGDPGGGGGGTGGPGVVPPVDPGRVDPGRVRNDLSQVTRDTAKKAGDAVTPVSPPAGQAVTDTGQALSEIVDSLPTSADSVKSP